MRRFVLLDASDRTELTINRSMKTIPLYNIYCPRAEKDIEWNPTRLVPYTEAELIVYFQSGRNVEAVEQFRRWADLCERGDGED